MRFTDQMRSIRERVSEVRNWDEQDTVRIAMLIWGIESMFDTRWEFCLAVVGSKSGVTD